MSYNKTRPVSRSARRRQLPSARRDFVLESHRSTERNDRSFAAPPPRRTNGTVRPWQQRLAAAADVNTSTVLLVHGMENMSVNCDQLFNLFCLYGNVETVKILKDKQALVQLEDAEAAKRCVANLHKLPLDGGGRKLNVKYSKHSFIRQHGNIYRLQDGTPAVKDYSTSSLNRFKSTRRQRVDKFRPAAPSKILHFFNAPTDICGVKLQRAVTGVVGRKDAVKSIVILPAKQGDRCSTGLVELKTIDLAAKVLCRLNHAAFTSTKSRFPFLVKLCFSKWTKIEQKSSAVALIGNVAPHRPWLRHGSERGVFTSGFPVSKATRVSGVDNQQQHAWTLLILSGGGGGDTAEIVTATGADPTAANRAPRPGGHQQQASRDVEHAPGERPNAAAGEDRGDAAVQEQQQRGPPPPSDV